MSEPQTQVEATQQQVPQTVKSDIEQNLAKQRLYYENKLLQERRAREEAERRAQELSSIKQKHVEEDDDDDDEPYVDRRKLTKTLSKFSQQTRQETQSEIQKAVQMALNEERKQGWLKQNNDFYDVMAHAEKLAQKDPELAEAILAMPDTFERQKLVYKNIKSMGLHLPPEEKKNDVQDRINKNRQSPNYHPSNIPTSPYNTVVGDFSEAGRKAAYERVQALKKNLRI